MHRESAMFLRRRSDEVRRQIHPFDHAVLADGQGMAEIGNRAGELNFTPLAACMGSVRPLCAGAALRPGFVNFLMDSVVQDCEACLHADSILFVLVMRMTWLMPTIVCVSLAGIAVVAEKLATRAPATQEALSVGFAATAAPAQPRYLQGAKACLAEAVYFETKGTSLKASQAVAHVVLNRREHEEFPESVCAVVEDGCQFSYQCDGEPERMADTEERDKALRAAEMVLEDQSIDPTDGALYFHAESAPAGWFETLDRTVQIGGNIFYR